MATTVEHFGGWRNLGHDYFLHIKDGILAKSRLDESKHLLRLWGRVPCIDAELWDKYQFDIRTIQFDTKQGHRLFIPARTFDQHKSTINCGYGKQYVCHAKHWRFFTIPDSERRTFTKPKRKGTI